jgi:predicted glutamine amidotransferase
MSRRLWGACTSEQGMLGTALGPERLSLRIEAGRRPVGWGIGYFKDGEPLVRKCPLEEREEVDLRELMAETRSDLVIGHVREPTAGTLRAENTHPFRFRHWLFAHSGAIRRFDLIKAQMRDALPSFLQRAGGETDSETFFHLVLAFLHDARKLDAPWVDAKTVSEALVKAVVMVDELEAKAGGEKGASAFAVLMSAGNFLVALHRGPPQLSYATYEAPTRDKIRPRAVIVACDQTTRGSSWVPMPDQSVLEVERSLAVEVTAF